ncbi:DUF4132 domain-containing protein [Microbacterium maritypicum]|uniref:DUF4132 domain-containing protein n=1 Tax=Microbacterium maritypicum TaxID=33918 RepID=A0AAD3X1P3_MICMQ|nr:DUF5724 domain-containing protein [Microbacterium liquefaciens]KAB1883826.1 DUF4132 domain-containing protein [Microbacterium liquefaciens]
MTAEQAHEELQKKCSCDHNGRRPIRASGMVAPRLARRIAENLNDRSGDFDAVVREELKQQAAALATELDQLSDGKLRKVLVALCPPLGTELAAWWERARSERSADTLSSRWVTLDTLLRHVNHYPHPVEWQATWLLYFGEYTPLGEVFASVLDAGNPEVRRILIDSLEGTHPVGGPSREGYRALLAANDPAAWEFVGRQLLEAGRAEGLRQTILEAAPAGHPDAFAFLLELIVENDLVRFSSTIHALSGWTRETLDTRRSAQAAEALATLATVTRTPPSTEQLRTGSRTEAFLGLWALAFRDIEATIAAASVLLAEPDAGKRLAAARILVMLARPAAADVLVTAFADGDLAVLRTALGAWWVDGGFVRGPAPLSEGALSVLRERVHQVGVSQNIDTGILASRIEALKRSDLVDLLTAASGPDEIDLTIASADARRYAVAKFAKDPTKYRAELFTLALDVSWHVRTSARVALEIDEITGEEALLLEKALTRKTDDIRKTALQLLQKQGPDAVEATLARLRAGKPEQRRAADELAQLAGLTESGAGTAQAASTSPRDPAAQDEPTGALRSDATTTPTGTAQLPALLHYGVEDRTPAVRPIAPPTSRWAIYHPGARRIWQSLGAWLDEHASVEVHTPGGVELLSNVKGVARNEDGSMPLEALVEPWWERISADLVDGGVELDLLRLLSAGTYPLARQVIGDLGEEVNPSTRSLRLSLIEHLARRERRSTWVDPVLDLIDLEASQLPVEELIGPRNVQILSNRHAGVDPRESAGATRSALGSLDPAALDDGQLDRLWRTLRFIDEPEGVVDQWSGERIELSPLSRWHPAKVVVDQPFRFRPPLRFVIEAFERGIASRADLIDHVVTHPSLNCELNVIEPNPLALFSRITSASPQVQRLVEQVQRAVVDLELPRGEFPTPNSVMAMALQRATGAESLVAVLQALGRRPFVRRYLYVSDRDGVLSHLVRIHTPGADETVESVGRAFAGSKIPESRIVETAMYAPQWAELFEQHLGWPGFASAVWWVHAHTPADFYEIKGWVRTERASEIHRRTPVTDEDREVGSADVQWFARMHAELGDDRLDRVLKAAKYASTAGQQKQAELFANVLRGRTGEDELLTRMHEKRHQDAVRAYGLLPLSGDSDEVLRRYEVLRGFVRSGKTSGPQRRATETAAVHTALENLARAAGYRDPQRLTWAMEARTAADLGRGAVTAVDGDVTVSLSIDDLGMPVIEVDRAGKPLAAVPAKSRKVEGITALTVRARELKKQAQRMRESLEAACVVGDVIDAEELSLLQSHPILGRMLPELVMVDGEGRAGFLSAGGDELILADESVIRAVGGLRIAHPLDLLTSGDWPDLQHAVMTRGRPQPFKQLFRELYVLNENEQAEQGISSRRYVGHQLDSRRAAGLFAARGWVRDHGLGYERTFHNERIIAFCNTSGGWGTPGEVEEAVTDDVRFGNVGSRLAIPLSEVPPRVFSETMRDLDLVVSVAHVSGVDPQSSESTIELRARIVDETCRLLGMRNVEADGHHVRIKGALGTYSVHLGSGIVHRIPGDTLFIIPVSAQHRGRVFLPFVDDDPRTAEIVSKVVMLSADDKIKDPTILRQLVR